MRFLLILLIGLIADSSLAAVEPYWIFLSDTGSNGSPATWTVPAGKIFVIKAVALTPTSPYPTNTQVRFTVAAENMVASSYMSIIISDTFSYAYIRWLPEDMPVKAGKQLAVPVNATFTSCRYYGLLIDEADLYAQNIPVELNNLEMAGGLFEAEARYASARPRITRIATSTTLDTFVQDSAGIVTAGATRDLSLVSVPDTDQRKFMRVIATARN